MKQPRCPFCTPAFHPLAALLAIVWALSGCAVTSKVELDKTRYVLCENGTIKNMYAINAEVDLYSVPIIPFEGGQTGAHLVDSSVPPSKFGLYHKLERMPRWRRVSDLYTLAYAVGPPYSRLTAGTIAADREMGGPGMVTVDRVPIRWIVSTNPLVVALGTDDIPRRIYGGEIFYDDGLVMGATFALPRETDLGHSATDLIILDHWPREWPDFAKDHDGRITKAFNIRMENLSRRLRLPGPTPLRDLMNKRPWE